MLLVVDQGSRTGQSFPLAQPVIDIGRSAENEIVLRDQGVSRHHARIHRESQRWILSDLGSTNGTYVNGHRLTKADVLRTGDRVTIGNAVLIVQEAGGGSVPEAAGDRREERASATPRPTLMILGAILVVVVLVGIVLLVVTMLQPEPQPPPMASTIQVEELLGTLPVPTQMRELVPGLVTAIPQDLIPLRLGKTATPEPQ